jgi:diguanylate cyclase (GGDEF)-like protein
VSGVNPYRILIVDDNAAIHADFRKVLCAPVPSEAHSGLDDLEAALFDQSTVSAGPVYELDSAFQGEEGLAKVRAAQAAGQPYAMVFVDMRMPPGWDGVQTLREMWKVEPKLQAAICTAYSDYSPEQITTALGRAGKMVIVRKPFEAIEIRQLAETLCEKWEIAQHRADLARQVEARTAELKQATLQDSLTGLPNRALFAEKLSAALARSKTDPTFKFAVLFLDCDNFKSVNDTIGHQAGDELLRQIAGRIRRATRNSDALTPVHPNDPMAARLGGDEFAVLVTGLTVDTDAIRVAERLLDAAAAPYDLFGRQVSSAMSIGVATSSVTYASPDEMIRDADSAMYQAKQTGRGRYVMFDQAQHDIALARLNMEVELRMAVENGQIRPYYQPIVSTATRELVGFEALARWHHPTRGVVSPSDFIPLAEQTGIIVPLGFKMFEEACRQLAEWDTMFPGRAKLTMGINLSRKQLSYPRLLETFQQILNRHGTNPDRLHLEVTESTIMDDARKSLEVLHRLREMNLNLHMDDFGTGHSSLSCLHQLPLDGLKMDRSFVGDLRPGNGVHPVMNAIQNLAVGMNLPVVAEGVESEAQFQKIREVGCSYVQGFLFSKPLTASDATTLLKHEGQVVPRAA